MVLLFNVVTLDFGAPVPVFRGFLIPSEKKKVFWLRL
jgi:hypothetical protein